MHIELSWQETINRMDAVFRTNGVRVVRSFDLQTAREGMVDPSSCPCPYHGTERCTCQYLVYLVYSEEPGPMTIVVHGHDDLTNVEHESPRSDFERDLWQDIAYELCGPRSPAETGHSFISAQKPGSF